MTTLTNLDAQSTGLFTIQKTISHDYEGSLRERVLAFTASHMLGDMGLHIAKSISDSRTYIVRCTPVVEVPSPIPFASLYQIQSLILLANSQDARPGEYSALHEIIPNPSSLFYQYVDAEIRVFERHHIRFANEIIYVLRRPSD